MPRAETTLIEDAFVKKPGQLFADCLIFLPPQPISMLDALVDLLTFFCWPRLQPGIYRGEDCDWKSYPDGRKPNLKTKLHLIRIWTGEAPNVQRITTKKEKS